MAAVGPIVSYAAGGGDRDAALAALAWLVESGVDTLVEATPHGWLMPAVAPAAQPAMTVAAPAMAAPPARAAKPLARPSATPHDLHALAAGTDSLAALKAAIATLHPTPPLFADGNPDDGHADGGVMLIGDMPGADDIAAGKLFAGGAGRLLDRMIAAIGRDRADTYLANLFYWPATIDAASVAATLPLIRRHIRLAKPRALLVLGGSAAAALLGVTSGIGRLRGQWATLDLDGLRVPLLPSFAPSYLLAHPAHKALAWRDLQTFHARLSQ